jgi:hypothetical protein
MKEKACSNESRGPCQGNAWWYGFENGNMENQIMNILLGVVEAVLVMLFIFYDRFCSLWPEEALETSWVEKK